MLFIDKPVSFAEMFPGKKKEEAVEESSDEDGDSDSDYIETFGQMDFEDNTNSDDSSYAPDNEDTATCVKPKVTNLKRQGKIH